jgi:MFS family permease
MGKYKLFQISFLEFVTQFIILLMLFTWFQASLIYISAALDLLNGSYIERIMSYSSYCLSFIVTSLIYPNFVGKHAKTYILYFWLVLAIISSSLFIILMQHIFFPLILAGIALGLGMPYCLSYFADHTEIENRGKIGGIIFFLTSLTMPIFSFLRNVLGLYLFSLFSAVWISFGLILVLLLKPRRKDVEISKDFSLASIVTNKQFYLYFIAWVIYYLIDSTGSSTLRPFLENAFGTAFRNFALNLSTLIMAFSIVTIGFVIDVYGRKRALLYGFVALGIAYACVGIDPLNLAFWYLYFVISGAASGFFVVIFVFTIWGDISPRGAREKYYAVGSLPFFFMVFVSELLAPYTESIPVSTAFSFASFFLFLAVLPLIYAPETLPEREIRRRELKDYIKKAKKIVGKY